MTIGSKSQSNDRENDLDRMEMMEVNISTPQVQ